MSIPVVLITGGLTGIGRATAIAFAKEGARVVVAGRREDVGQQLTAELRKLGAEAEFIRADVRHEDEVRDLVDQTVARFGRLDLAVNNAGTAIDRWGVQQEGSYDYLKTIKQPTLVVNGSNDVLTPTINSFIMEQNIPTAELIIYPDSNHGSQHQYPGPFVRQVSMFLEDQGPGA